MTQAPSRKRKYGSAPENGALPDASSPARDAPADRPGPEAASLTPRANAQSGSAAEPRTRSEAASDVMLIHGVSEDGQSLAVLRARGDRLETGIVRKTREGEPITGELLRLTPRPESPLLCDVQVELPAQRPPPRDQPTPKLSHGGPAQVATPEYRHNWDTIWSKTKPPSLPN